MPLIKTVEVFPAKLPITGLFTFGSGSTGEIGGVSDHVFVKVTDETGQTGWGEARPVPGWSYETPESVTSTVRSYLAPALIGMEVFDRSGIQRRMAGIIGVGPSTGQPIAKAGVDMAVHDLCARSLGVPLRTLLGGSPRPNTVALSWTVTSHTPREAQAEAKAAHRQGFVHFNFKVGLPEVDDVEIAHVLRDAAGPGAFLWADANQSLSGTKARYLAVALDAAGVDVLEQPCSATNISLMRTLRSHTTLPLAIDEASVSPTDFLDYVREGLVDYLVLKLARSGGVWPSNEQLAIAEAAGLPTLVSGLAETALAKLAACQVAAARGATFPAALNGSQFIDDSSIFPDKMNVEKDGEVLLQEVPGIGITPDEVALRECEYTRSATQF